MHSRVEGMSVEIDVLVTTRDGLTLAADVFRPDRDGTFPVLLTYGPYGKSLHFADGYAGQWRHMCEDHPDIPAGSTNQFQAWELPDPEKWVPDGYVLVRVDSRGSGRSPGYIDPWSPQETQDLYDCIEWAAAQPWSTGKVGLTGISYYAMNQWQAAALRPPHLAAICPWEGTSDAYRELSRHGGMLCSFLDGWYAAQVATVQNGLGANAATSRIDGRSVAGETTLSPDELAQRRIDLSALMREHPFDDDIWHARRAVLEKIEVPVLAAGNWGGPPHLRGSVEGFLRVGSDQKWLELHGLEHWTHYYTDYGRLLQKEFFDHFLHDKDNGWADRPRVILNARHVDGTFEHRAEEDWPLPQTVWTRLHLDADHAQLTVSANANGSSVSYIPGDAGATFRFPVDEELEITGPLAAKLFVSSETSDADLFVIVRVLDPNDAEVTFVGVVDPRMPVTSGWLRASRRRLDPSLSSDVRPYHSHLADEPLTPGEVYEVDIEIWPTSVIIPAGYTLALTVQGIDFDHGLPDDDNDLGWLTGMRGVGPFFHADPQDRPDDVFTGRVTVHSGGTQDSYLLVPFVPRQTLPATRTT